MTTHPAPEPATHEMLIAGSRAIGNSMNHLNQYERAKIVWDAMIAARGNPDDIPPIPSANGDTR